MQFRLRTLLIVVAITPLICAAAWYLFGFGSDTYRRTLRADSANREELLAATPPGTPALKVLSYVVHDLGHEGAQGNWEWKRAYDASTGQRCDVTPIDERTVVATVGKRTVGPLEVENVDATWHFDDNDQVSDITVERYTFGP